MSDINRMNGKVASDALKKGNNAGMNYLKQTKAAAPLLKVNPREGVRQIAFASAKLRVAEKGPNGTVLRSYVKN